MLLTVFYLATGRWWDCKAATKARETTSTILLLIGVSATDCHQPLRRCRTTGAAAKQMTTTPWVITFAGQCDPVRLGTFCDMAATILLCTPIFLPIMRVGMDPVQFGMVCC